MRNKKAKAIRRGVYGEYSRRERQYKTIGTTVICTGKRAEYLAAKKTYKPGQVV